MIEYFDKPEPGYALEVFDALGHTVDVLSVPESYLEPIREGERRPRYVRVGQTWADLVNQYFPEFPR